MRLEHLLSGADAFFACVFFVGIQVAVRRAVLLVPSALFSHPGIWKLGLSPALPGSPFRRQSYSSVG